jgi:hypothetical protein
MKAHEIPPIKEKPFQKDDIFRTFFINFSTPFLGPQRLGVLLDIRYFRKPRLLL